MKHKVTFINKLRASDKVTICVEVSNDTDTETVVVQSDDNEEDINNAIERALAKSKIKPKDDSIFFRYLELIARREKIAIKFKIKNDMSNEFNEFMDRADNPAEKILQERVNNITGALGLAAIDISSYTNIMAIAMIEELETLTRSLESNKV